MTLLDKLSSLFSHEKVTHLFDPYATLSQDDRESRERLEDARARIRVVEKELALIRQQIK